MTLDRSVNNVKDHDYMKNEIALRHFLLSRFLQAMREDLSEWISSLSFHISVQANNFLPSLENGIILCQHARLIQRYAEEYAVLNPGMKLRIPAKEVHYTEKGAYPGSFVARDNVANFIHWCRELGIPEVVIFESEDLVLHKNEKSVILTLMDVARKAFKFGVQPPEIVRFEKEIDEEIERDKQNEKMGRPPPKPRDLEEDNNLDTMVRNIVNKCTCCDRFPIKKLAEGKYQLGRNDTLIFVRVMRKHVMVRVGGGWDTLDNYITKHDPCRTKIAGNIEGDGHTLTPSNKNITSTPRKKSIVKTDHSRLQDSAYSSDTWSMCSGSSDGSGSLDSSKMECSEQPYYGNTPRKVAQRSKSNTSFNSTATDEIPSASDLPITFNKSIKEIDHKLKLLENNKPKLDLTLKDTDVYDIKGDRWLRSHLNSIKQRRSTEHDVGETLNPMQEFGRRRGHTADNIKRDKNNNRTPMTERKSQNQNNDHLSPQVSRTRSKTAPKTLSNSLEKGLNSSYHSLPRPRRKSLKAETKSSSNVYYDASSISSLNSLSPSPSKSCCDISTQTVSTQTHSPLSSQLKGIPRALRNLVADSSSTLQSRIPRPKLQRSNTMDGLTTRKKYSKNENNTPGNDVYSSLRREKSDLTNRMVLRREKSDLTGRRSKNQTGVSRPQNRSDTNKNEKPVRVRNGPVLDVRSTLV